MNPSDGLIQDPRRSKKYTTRQYPNRRPYRDNDGGPKIGKGKGDGLQNAQHELISSLWNSSGWLGDGVHGKYVYKSAILCAIWRLRRVTLDALALVVIGNDKAAKMCASVNRQWF